MLFLYGARPVEIVLALPSPYTVFPEPASLSYDGWKGGFTEGSWMTLGWSFLL